MSSSNRVREAGFPRVADLLDAGLPHAAWNELRRFRPFSIDEARSFEQAQKAMPEIASEDE